jgi:hypothetical protein
MKMQEKWYRPASTRDLLLVFMPIMPCRLKPEILHQDKAPQQIPPARDYMEGAISKPNATFWLNVKSSPQF